MSERLADYLLGELDMAEADPALEAQAAPLRPVVARLEALDREMWEPVAAPALMLPAALPGQAEAPPAPRRRRVLRLRPLVATGLAALLLAVGFGAGRLLGGEQEDGGRVLALAPVGRTAARGTATIAPGDKRATIVVRGLEPSARGDFYELWLMNSATDLVSLGAFRVPASGDARVTVPLPADPAAYAALDVSLEPPDGNPAHSSRSVLRGKTS